MNKRPVLFKIIDIIQKPYNLLPKFICNLVYDFSSVSEGKFALLIRYLYVKRFAKSVGNNVYIGKYVSLKNIKNLSIGNNVSIHAYNYIDASGFISIGNNVSIANHCTLISSDHTWNDKTKPIKYNSVNLKPITIMNDVWIAAGVRVLGNTTIKNRCVIGAGAIVNKTTEEHGLYVGVPIKKVRSI